MNKTFDVSGHDIFRPLKYRDNEGNTGTSSYFRIAVHSYLRVFVYLYLRIFVLLDT